MIYKPCERSSFINRDHPLVPRVSKTDMGESNRWPWPAHSLPVVHPSFSGHSSFIFPPFGLPGPSARFPGVSCLLPAGESRGAHASQLLQIPIFYSSQKFVILLPTEMILIDLWLKRSQAHTFQTPQASPKCSKDPHHLLLFFYFTCLQDDSYQSELLCHKLWC